MEERKKTIVFISENRVGMTDREIIETEKKRNEELGKESKKEGIFKDRKTKGQTVIKKRTF